MASTNKTDKLKLNKWLGSDKIQRIDFNNDNDAVEKEFSDRGVNLEWFPYINPEVTDSPRIQRAIDSLTSGGILRFPNSTLTISSEITVKDKIIYELGSVILQATSSIPAIFGSDKNTRLSKITIRGGKLDCNGLAQIGIHLRNYKDDILLDNINIENPALIHLKLGDSTASNSSYQAVIRNVIGDRQRPTPQPIGSIGLSLENATDNVFDRCIFVGAETGVKTVSGASGNNFINVHVWSRLPENVMTDGFTIESTDNFFTNCIADTPQRYGFKVSNWRNNFLGCKIYNNTNGTNNQVVGFRLDIASQHINIIGSIFHGESSHVLAKDIEFEDESLIYANNYNIFGSSWTYCNSKTTIGGYLNLTSDTANVDFNIKRNDKNLWQVRMDTSNDYVIVQRDDNGSAWVRDAIRFNRSNGLATLGGTGLIIPKVTALPTASSTYRGCIVRVEGGAGVADAEYICKKLADNSYAWKQLSLI